MLCQSCGETLPDRARFCPACGAGADTAPAPATAEKRKLVTVVFCDLVGSTELSGKLDPETLRSVVLRYFAAMRAPIERFGGTVEKFIGDAVMAVFGIPAMHEDDAERAAAAALAMLAELDALNAELAPALGVRLQVRIGVNTGHAVTSTDVSTRQALVTGETVNLAARLEQNAGPGEILVGPATAHALGAAARTESVGELSLKGKAEPVLGHRLLSLAETAPERGRRFDGPLVGRQADIAELDRALADAVRTAAPVMVRVLGEPGIGKSRLVRTWLDGLDPGPDHPAVGVGRCRPFGDRASLEPLAEAVRQLLADGPAPDAETLSVLESGLLADGTPGMSVEATCAALACAVAGGPAVLVLDDCQWASPVLSDVLERLLAVTSSALLVVVLARLDVLDVLDERRPRPADRRSITLTPLTEADCRTLLAELAGGTLDPPRTRAVIEASGGNPFHLEQLLAWHEDTEMPQSLQALLGARIDGVPAEERTVLDLAAVLGREFRVDQLAALTLLGAGGTLGGRPLAARVPASPDPVVAMLTRLNGRRFVEPASVPGGSDAAFRFSSGLIRDAAYLTMAKSARADLHERAAGVVTGVASAAVHLDQSCQYREELGLRDDHTRRVRERAAALLAEAGAHALKRSDLAWAGRLLERAVALSEPGQAWWSTTTRHLGEVRVAAGQVEEGRALFRSVLASTAWQWHSRDRVEYAHARLALAVSDPSSPVGAAADAARETLPVFRAEGDDLGLARAHVRMAQSEQFRGRNESAVRLLHQAVAAATRCAAEPELALALGALGISLWRGPTPVPEAIATLRGLVADLAGPRPVVEFTLSCPLAVLLALDGEPEQARAVLERAGHSPRARGFAEVAVLLPVFEAAIETHAGRPDLALVLLDQACQAAEELGAGALTSGVARDSARLLLDLGRPDEAADRLDAPGIRDGLLDADAADLDGLRARILAARGEVREALVLADRAVAGAAGTDSPIVTAVAHLDRSEVLASAGDTEQALAAAEAALQRFAAKGHRPGAGWARARLDRLGALPNPLPTGGRS